jgi:hypothetical protein
MTMMLVCYGRVRNDEYPNIPATDRARRSRCSRKAPWWGSASGLSSGRTAESASRSRPTPCHPGVGQPVAANAGLAPITTAVPTATAAPILDASMTYLSTAWRNGGVLTLDIFRSTPVVHALS